MAAGTAIRAAVAVGEINERRQLQSIRKGAQVLIATPGRLFDFLGRQLLDLQGVFVLVLDEADRMLDMGFLPTIRKIMAAASGAADVVLLGYHRNFRQTPGGDACAQRRAYRSRFHD